MLMNTKYHFVCTSFSAEDTTEIKKRLSKKYIWCIFFDLIFYFLFLFFPLKKNFSMISVTIFHVGIAICIISNIVFLLKTQRLKEKEIVQTMLKDAGHPTPDNLYMTILRAEPETIFLIQTRPVKREDIQKNRSRWFQLQSQYDIPQKIPAYMETLLTENPEKAVIYMDVIEEQLQYGNMKIFDGLLEDGSLKYYQFKEGDTYSD